MMMMMTEGKCIGKSKKLNDVLGLKKWLMLV
jgi:hypothetical protein